MKFLNLGKRKKKQSKKEKKVKTLVYNSLDELPLYNWNKVYDTKDFRFILVNATPQNIDTLPFQESDLVYGWEKLYDEYMTLFGLTEKFKRVLKVEKKIALLTCEMLLKEKKHLATKISIARKQLADLQINKNETADFDRQIGYVEKWMAISIDPKQISTKRFYTYLQMYEEEAQRVNKKMNDGKN